MPEEPDVSPEEMEILDRVLRKQIEAKKQERQRQAEQIQALEDRIMHALQTRPEGMTWREIRELFDGDSEEQIRQALSALMLVPLIRTRVEIKGEPSGERFLLAAG